MNLIRVKKYFSALAAVFTIGILGCGSDQDNGKSKRDQPTPLKDIPAVTAPAFSYDFYEPKSEGGLKNDTNYGYLIAKTRPGFKTAHFDRLGLKVAGYLEAGGASYYRLYKADDVMGAIKGLKKISGVMFAEPEMLRALCAVEADPVEFDDIDYYLQNRLQWGAYTTKAFDAWATYGFGPNRPVVASVDTGVQYNHEDLKSVVKHAYTWFNPDGNNYYEAMPANPYDEWDPLDAKEAYPNNWGTDFTGHGTHTSGIICAAGNNGTGGAGMCWNVDFINYQGFGLNEANSIWTIFGSIWHMAKWKKDNDYSYTIPMNCSFGGQYASQFEIDIIEYALQNGVMLIAASGNNGYRWHTYPAAYAGVMAVGASDGADRRALFSNYGPWISVVAPGANIMSTVGTAQRHDSDTQNKNGYSIWSGTSMAAPHVTGLAAYMLTFNPELRPDQIKTYIERYSDYVDGANGYTEETGWGRVNALNTIKAVIDDLNAGRAPATSYAAAPVKITSSFSGMSVFLYNCNESGGIQNYVSSSFIGFREFDGEDGECAAYFNMLRPGRYIAHAYIGAANAVASTAPFNVEAGQQEVMEVELGFGREFLTIQTFPTWDLFEGYGANGSGSIVDTEIWLYNTDSGNPDDEENAYYYDVNAYDTTTIPLPEPGAYWIRITDFMARPEASQYYENSPWGGEYALYVTKASPWSSQYYVAPDQSSDGTRWELPPGDPNSGSGPFGNFTTGYGGQKGAQATSFANAQAIAFNTIYYGAFSGNYYNGGTSGLAGHYYKFTVTPQE